MTGTVTLYFSDTPGKTEIRKQQMRIKTFLESQKIPFNIIDVAQDHDALDKMRELVEDENAVAPHIANGDEYCGNFDKFEEAVEQENLLVFLKLK